MNKIGLFYKIFFSIAIVGILLISGMGFYIFKSSYDSVYKNLLRDKERYIDQISNNMDQKIENIEFAFNAYSSTPDFDTIFQNPITETDFQKYQKVKSELNYIAIMGTENTYFSLISLKHQWMLRGDQLIFLSKGETDTYNNMLTKTSENKNLYWEPNENGIRMIFALPGFQMERYALGIAEIPLSTINKILSIENGSRVAIVDQYNKVLFSNYQLKKEVIKEISNTSKGTSKLPNGDILYVKSDYNNWIYSIELTKSEVLQSIRNTGIALVIVNIILIFMVLVFAYIVAEYFTRPVVNIQKKLLLKNEGILSNDLILIDHQIDNILQRNQSLSDLVTRQKPELEKLFIYSLLRGELSDEEITKKLIQFNYVENKENYQFVLLQFDDSEYRQELDLVMLAILNDFGEFIPKEHYFAPIVQNEKTIATIIRYSSKLTISESQELLSNLIEGLQKNIKNILEVQISAGISNRYESLGETSEKYEEAFEALRYRIKLGKESIIFYNDLALLFEKRNIPSYPYELENKLIDDLKLGYRDEASNTLKMVINEIISRNDNPVDYEIAVIRLVNNIITLAQSMYIDLLKTQGNRQLFKTILETSSHQQLYELLQEHLIEPIIVYVTKNDSERMKSIADTLLEIIHNEYNEEVTLDSIADKLHYDPHYLSKVFKKELGINFSDYLMNYRLEKSKELLIHSEYTVKEISELLQYNNPQNFIRFFKKMLGITPGEYRKTKKYS
ncbi:response regulator transcription factor [Fredinandcohnia onubensis]|uniref:response regulator transcription factor n=1 Tax=Fredinandcohnia onubensis TaxID=1571209 RepID=UPI000C0BCD9E|nr:response regulator transcription factor [Fredinandcohnia onubensis]